MSYVDDIWNDVFSSLRVYGKCTLEVFEHRDFNGQSKEYYGGDDEDSYRTYELWTGTATWDDKISSWKCNCECVAGDMAVQTMARGDVETRDLLSGDMIPGLDANMEEKWCVVKDVVKVGRGALYGNFTANHLIMDLDGRITTHGATPHLRYGDLYSVLTDCPAMKNANGVLFTPLAEVFCGASDMAWEEYVFVFDAILQIIDYTGTEWLHVDTFYRNCLNSTDCKHQYWQDALPGVCHSMLQCAKLGDDASCDNFENVAWRFFKEHVTTDMYHTVIENSYIEQGSNILADSIRNRKPIHALWYFWMSMSLLIIIVVLGCYMMFCRKNKCLAIDIELMSKGVERSESGLINERLVHVAV